MALREEIQRRIDKKRLEVTELRAKIRDAETYIQALEDTVKLIPRESGGTSFASPLSTDLRAGSRVAKTRDFLRNAVTPQQVMAILRGIGDEPTSANRAALSGSLSAYVRKGEIFTRPAPNVFGLVEFDTNPKPKGAPEPPSGFGDLEENDPFDLGADEPEMQDAPEPDKLTF